MQLLPGADEDVLGDLVGFARSEHPPRQTVHLADVGAIKTFERRGVAGGRQGHIGIGVRGCGGAGGGRHNSSLYVTGDWTVCECQKVDRSANETAGRAEKSVKAGWD